MSKFFTRRTEFKPTGNACCKNAFFKFFFVTATYATIKKLRVDIPSTLLVVKKLRTYNPVTRYRTEVH